MSRVSRGEGGYFDRLVGEFSDLLPQLEVMPQLSAEEVERFVALGREGWDRLRLGDEPGAEAAFRGQIAIFPVNPEPHVSLALLAARRREEKAAIEHLRAAVIRGFTDLARIERAESWTRMRNHPDFLGLQDAIPRLIEAERRWAGWDAFRARAPEDLASVFRNHETRKSLVEKMAPALGQRLVRLWKRLNDRATAALLEAYVAARPQASDTAAALDRLMSLYSGGPLFRWEPLSTASTRRLRAVANAALERFPDGPLRPGALACRALARYSDRDRRGAMQPGAADEIRAALGEVLSRHASSPFVAAAAEGLVRTETEAGRMDRAADVYRKVRDDHADDRSLLDDLRERLGVLALKAGGLPDFRAAALDGGTVEREALRGKVVVVDFWATWCRPCIEQFPDLRRIAERYGDRIVILGVNLDRADDVSPDDLREWISREKVPGRQIHDGLGWDSQLVKAFGAAEIPFGVVVGRDGSVLAVNEHGRRLEKTVQSAVE